MVHTNKSLYMPKLIEMIDRKLSEVWEWEI
jgi:hypothetical protein